MPMTRTFAEEGKSFLQSISEMDSHRLDRLKGELGRHARDNLDNVQTKHMIQDKIRQIEQVEDERHKGRVSEMQTNSRRNYEAIK